MLKIPNASRPHRSSQSRRFLGDRIIPVRSLTSRLGRCKSQIQGCPVSAFHVGLRRYLHVGRLPFQEGEVVKDHQEVLVAWLTCGHQASRPHALTAGGAVPVGSAFPGEDIGPLEGPDRGLGPGPPQQRADRRGEQPHQASSGPPSVSGGYATTASRCCSTPVARIGTYSPPSHPAEIRSAGNRCSAYAVARNQPAAHVISAWEHVRPGRPTRASMSSLRNARSRIHASSRRQHRNLRRPSLTNIHTGPAPNPI
jgi:hypothetical protein